MRGMETKSTSHLIHIHAQHVVGQNCETCNPTQRLCPACRHFESHGWTEGECLCAEADIERPAGYLASPEPRGG